MNELAIKTMYAVKIQYTIARLTIKTSTPKSILSFSLFLPTFLEKYFSEVTLQLALQSLQPSNSVSCALIPKLLKLCVHTIFWARRRHYKAAIWTHKYIKGMERNKVQQFGILFWPYRFMRLILLLTLPRNLDMLKSFPRKDLLEEVSGRVLPFVPTRNQQCTQMD